MKKLFAVLLLSGALLSPSSAVYSTSHANIAGYEMTAATQCKGQTKKRARCRNKTTNANGYCHLHQSQVPKK